MTGLIRTAIYARYSSELQRDASIEDQVRACKARIEAEGWAVAATYTDHALSGASRLRPGYQKLLEDARAGEFDAVIAEAPIACRAIRKMWRGSTSTSPSPVCG
jgi:site-specific DNA recombinase